jgi:hypothetical protein
LLEQSSIGHGASIHIHQGQRSLYVSCDITSLMHRPGVINDED